MKYPLFLSDFNHQVFEEYSNVYSWSQVVPCGRTDVQTDMTKLTVTFCNLQMCLKFSYRIIINVNIPLCRNTYSSSNKLVRNSAKDFSLLTEANKYSAKRSGSASHLQQWQLWQKLNIKLSKELHDTCLHHWQDTKKPDK